MRGYDPRLVRPREGAPTHRRWPRWIPACVVALAGVSLMALPARAGAGREVGVAPTAGAVSGASDGGLHVIPFPGTPDASRGTTIIFSSLGPSDLRSISVRGSRSGTHAGHLVLLPDGAGVGFVPDRPFTGGEHVGVTAWLRTPAAGTASGDPGATRLRFSFGVGGPAQVPLGGAQWGVPGTGARQARAGGQRGRPAPTQSFRSVPGMHPPIVDATSNPDRSSGSIFLSIARQVPQEGPMILNSQGQLVWFRPLKGMESFNTEVQRYQGRPVLTWWQDQVIGTSLQGDSQDMIMNRHYQVLKVLHGGNGYSAGIHEFQVTPQGTALIDFVDGQYANLTSVGGPSHGLVYDTGIQELDIKTNQVLWEWHSLGHIPLKASEIPYTRPYDPYHLNSIQQLPDGNLLISLRNTWGVYEIDRQTGKVLWTLGGKYSNFTLPHAAGFEWQHDAHMLGNTVSVFDDGDDGYRQEERRSSGKLLRLDFKARTATLVHRYTHSPPLLSDAMGSVQVLPNGNVFVGWGVQPDFSEYTASGRQIFNGTLPLNVVSYRAYRFPWTGEPVSTPSVALSPQGNGDVKVYASWNGATRVASWRVLGGGRPSSLGPFFTGRRTGFETAITLHSQPRYLAIQALDAHGHVLGTSRSAPDPSHLAVFAPTTFVRASSGGGSVGVGCFTGQECHVRLQVSLRGHELARSAAHTVSADSSALIPFRLSSAGRSALTRSSGHRLAVKVTVSDSSSGASANSRLDLVSYSISGGGPPRHASPSRAIQIAGTRGFVSFSSGRGQILAACSAPASPCELSTRITVGGRLIARTRSEHLGAGELGAVYFQLTRAGQAMLRNAPGNQLGARITVSNGHHTATGQIALVGYS